MAFSKLILSTFAILAFFSHFIRAIEVSHDGRAIKIDGERKILFSGSIHYPRSTSQMWPDLIAKAKEGGLDAIETYVFWNVHEPRPREYNFEGNLDLIRFIKEIQNAGLYAILRIGPYVCAEWNLGGLPAWLLQIPGMEFRTDNQPFEKEMKNFTTLIVNMVKEHGLLAPQGGPIILTQIENEYGNVQGPYGEAGKRYINWCANLAESLHVGVPWIMCQQDDAPQPMLNTCNGFYCNKFRPNNKNSPKMWTENWTGWFKAWGAPDPHRAAEDLAYSVARFFQTTGTLQNYYMYHGGTNFGRTTGGPYITTSYDYDAPLDEYGNIRQPKWGCNLGIVGKIKLFREMVFIRKYLVPMKTHFKSESSLVSKFVGEHITPGCLLSNENITTDISVEFQGKNYFLPAWSVSILPDCNEEVYNTAKVGTQTNVLIKKPNQAEDQSKLSWSWRPEVITNHVHGKKPLFSTNSLFEQVMTTADASDYLWYFTSVNSQKGNMNLLVNTTGHGLHVFVNGAQMGFQYSNNSKYGFVFENPISLKDGENHIALLSTTVGLKNYGAYYEKMPAGIVGGPVQLIQGNTTIDLSKNKWSYMTGLDGEERQIHLESANKGLKWSTKLLDRNRPFTWHKAAFQAPLGSDPVVVDLQGMGKGAAWVNGKSIGRIWPQYTAKEDGCTPCDYRGVFDSDRTCKTGCGESSQRWYHVPREFLNPGEPNTLSLFEEIGGNPSSVNFQTIAVGKICGNVFESDTLHLTCKGSTISKIEFASFGNPQGSCQAFKKGTCDAQETLAKVHQECVGKESCSIKADESLLGQCVQCGNQIKKLAVQAVCS